MNAARAKTGVGKPLLLTRPLEEILKAVHFYRYMTALDVTYLLYSPSSLKYVRDSLARLAGGEDFKPGQYLYRFRVASSDPGNPERIYTLGSRGRKFLVEELGMPVDWHFRPEMVRHLSYSRVAHALALTRFLVGAKVWAAGQPEFRLAEIRTSYELGMTPATVELGEGRERETVRVVPDAWLLFEQLQDGRHAHWLPVLLELDRGTEYQRKFKQHIRSRLEFIRRGGPYSRLFGHEAVTIAYATTGERPAYRETRRLSMCEWTKEVLSEWGMEKWASVFRFHALVPEDIYTTPIFSEPVWYQPDQRLPVSIFA